MLALGLTLAVIALLLLNAAFTGKSIPELLANVGAIKPSNTPSLSPKREA